MERSFIGWGLGLALAAGLGCATAIPHVSTDQAAQATGRWPEATAQSLEQGRTLYVSRCGGCHKPVPPAKKTAQEWPRWVGKMAPRARLTPEQRELIERYLVTVAP